jgi:hypothetical protein
MALPGVIALATLGGYAVLLPAVRWQGDEYIHSWLVAKEGLSFLFRSIVGPTPFPVAEAIRFAYFVPVE